MRQRKFQRLQSGPWILLALTYLGLQAKMRQAVAAENYALGTSMSSEFVNKIYKNVEIENKQEAINYEKMASYIVAAFIRAGIRVSVDERDFGRLIGEIIGT